MNSHPPPRPEPTNSLSFDDRNRTLWFVPVHFAARRQGRFVKFHPFVVRGAAIAVDTVIGEIQWNDGLVEDLVSPAAGVVHKVNRNIVHSDLDDFPPQFAIQFA